MRKRIISLILVLSMILTSALYLVACDNSGDNKDGGKTPSKETEKVTEGDKETGGDVESDPVSDKESDPETDPEDTDPADTEPQETDPVTEPDDPEPEETGCEHPYAALPEGHWKPACSVCGKGEGKLQSHEFEEKVEDEGDLLLYSFRCSVCKYRAYKQQVPYEINLFFSAGELATRVDVAGGYTQSFGFDSGVGFGSYSKEGSGTATISVMTGGDANVPTGKYLVMKVRLPRSQSSFSATIKSVHAANALPLSFMGLPSGWVTIVVDLTKAYSYTTTTDAETGETITTYSGYAPDAVGDFYLGDLKVTAKTVGDESFNFAYALLCDNLDDAKSFIENEKVVVTYDDILNGGGVTDKKECVDENGNPIEHKYIINDDGTHTLAETCYQCGLAAVENEPHTFSQTMIDGELTYACSACKVSQFGANINKYFSADDVNASACTYFRIIRNGDNGIGIDPVGGFEYMSFSSTGNTAQIIFARNTADSSDSEEAAAFNVGKAKYFIIRLRTNTVDQSFGINFSTTGSPLVDGKKNGVVVGQFHSSSTLKFPTTVGGADEWVTYVADLSTLISDVYAEDDTGTITLKNFYFHVGDANFSSEHVFDVQYMAFVDDWDEVEAMVNDEKVVSVSGNGTGSWVMTEGRACVGQHSCVVNNVDGVMRVECSMCGTVVKEFSVPEGINYYADLSKMDKMGNSLAKLQFDSEEGVLYNRYEGASGCHLNISGGSGGGKYTVDTYDTGSYILIKYRLKGTVNLEIATGDFGDNPQYTNPTRPLYSSIGTRLCMGGLTDWTVALIKIPDGINYTKGSNQQLGVRLTASGGEYIFDVSYFAVVDSIDEAKLLLEEGEEYVDLGESWAGNDTPVDTPDDDPPEIDREFTSTILGPDELVTPVENPTGKFDIQKLTEDGMEFVRISNMTVNGDGWAAVNYANSSHTVKGRYFAIKVRIGENGLNQSYLKLYTGTTGSLVSEGQGISFKVVEDGEWAVIVVDLLTRIKDKNTFMIQNSDGSYTIRYFALRPFSHIQAGGVKVDSTEADPDAKYMYKYINTAGRTRWSEVQLTEAEMASKGYATFDGIYKMSVQPEMYMDIAYIAFFEDMSQLKDVIDDEVYQWSVDASTNAPLKTEDGTCVICTPQEIANGSIYSYVCSFCGKEFATKTVSDGVKAYYSAGHIATAGTGALASGPQHYRLDKVVTDTNGAGASLIADGETVATRIYGNGMGQTAQLIWQKTNDDGKHNGSAAQKYTRDMGQAKYFVIRLRTNDPSRLITVNLSSEGVNGTSNVHVNVAAEGADKWATYVIDLEAAGTTQEGMGVWAKKVTTTDADGEGGNDPVTETAETYVMDTFFINFVNFSSTQYADIEFVAFAETWADVDTLTPDEVAYSITEVMGAFEKVNVADGSKVTE